LRLFGLEITRAKAAPALPVEAYYSGRAWQSLVKEPFTGAWQRNIDIRLESVLTHTTVYACIKLIASDVAKVRLRLVQQDEDRIWVETDSPSFSPVLRKPNRYQNRIQFFQWWMTSKLAHGNTYVLKARDNRKIVTGLYVLDPLKTKVLVAPDGSVFYQLSSDNLSGIQESVVHVPASEIIHDVMNPLYHPLCGVSPITACALAAAQGLAIARNSAKFFENGSQPSGILTAPGTISDETAARLKEHWETNYTGENAGRTAVLGDGLQYQAMSINATDAQVVEQLKWTDEAICRAFGVPAFKVGVGPMPSYNNIEALNQQYYSECLQILIETVELCLDEGLGIGAGVKTADGKTYGTEFDLDDLLRMDTATQVKTLAEGLKGLYQPDEARRKLNLPRTEGGDQVYLQQQNYSLAALAKRDAKDDPFATGASEAPAAEPPAANDDEPTEAEAAKALLTIYKGFAHVRR
jgi:HK97 family phage portal protein